MKKIKIKKNKSSKKIVLVSVNIQRNSFDTYENETFYIAVLKCYGNRT